MTRLHIRLIGIVSILTGVVAFAGGTLHVGLHQNWGHWLMVLGNILMVFTFTGLYAVQSRQSGPLGLLAYVLIIIGLLVNFATSLVILADISGLKTAHDVWMFWYIDLSLLLPGLYSLLIGILMFGLVTAYARVLPRGAGLLLALAAILDLPAELLSGLTILYEIALVLVLISLSWIGARLLQPHALDLSTRQAQAGFPQTS